MAGLQEKFVGAAAWGDVRGPDEWNGVAEFLFGVVNVALRKLGKGRHAVTDEFV